MTRNDNWLPTATPSRLQNRAGLLRNIRAYFYSMQCMEVETPLISSAGNTDPEIQAIRTDSGGFLRTSPEFALKRLVAAGYGDVFELGRVFRAGESGRFHHPEFTLLEWYRTGFDYHELMNELVTLTRFCGEGKFDHWAELRLSYRQLFQQHLDLDPFTADIRSLASAARKNGIDDVELDRDQWLDLLMGLVIQPALPEKGLTFVYDYPANQAALARVREDTPPVAERFELYLGRTELANGYQELTDAREQQKRFESENTRREKRGLATYPLDHHLISALEHGLPECAGVALGVDRLLMVIEDCDSLNDVTAFPFSRA